jgi:hypothetical protein
MAITKFETVEVNNLSFATSSYGETQTTKTLKFTSRPLISEVRANVATSEKFRIYSDLVQMKFNYTPNTRDIVDNDNLYSITYQNVDWRIADSSISNDRMSVTLICYFNKPSVDV